MTSRDRAELRYIADMLFRATRGQTECNYVIDGYSLRRLMDLIDKACKPRCRCKQCRKLEDELDIADNSYEKQICDLKEQLKEYQELPRLVV